MRPVEEAIGEKLRRSGPCCLDDVATILHNFSSVGLPSYRVAGTSRAQLVR